MSLGFFIDALVTVVAVTTPILLAATGELVVEKSGVINLGVEGMMLIGAVVGFAVTFNYGPISATSRRGSACSGPRLPARRPPCCSASWC